MIELKNDSLIFSFPEVHPDARMKIDFQRTLRIPDDGSDYPLPPGLGRFPMKHVDDHADAVPPIWMEHGGVMLPMYQSEALWLNFSAEEMWELGTSYPFAIKVAAGKTNAVTGEGWDDGLQKEPQDYIVFPEQPWLDGYCVEKGIIRQFVAMPLGSGYSAEEQITGRSEHGGIQITVYPMKRKVFERRFPKRFGQIREFNTMLYQEEACYSVSMDMALAPGGRMRQEIYDDPFEFDDWDKETSSRRFIHIANSLVWRQIIGEAPPTAPFTASEYTRHGLPWFDYYNDNGTALKGSEKLGKLKSVVEMAKEKGDQPLPENESVAPDRIVNIRKGLKENQVREGSF